MTLTPIPLGRLADAPLPEMDWTVSDLLPAGLIVLAAQPKAGKSWLTLQLAEAVARGEPFLGYPTEAGDVLWPRWRTRLHGWHVGRTCSARPLRGATKRRRVRDAALGCRWVGRAAGLTGEHPGATPGRA